ncbi:unannotated protein [freshwater metagenome]|uniref:Unannotated protein n=1 Tax=freshwater metagenome TaxID=449393 RepID=A0A6J7GHP0_9ZZZZ
MRKETTVTRDIWLDAFFFVNTVVHTYSINRDRGTITGGSYREPSGVVWAEYNVELQCGEKASSLIEVTAKDCCVFTRWSDGVVSNPRSDSSAVGKSVTAVLELKKFDLAYSANSGGSITGSTAQQVKWGTSATAVTAVATNGYRFSSWSDGITTATRTDTDVKSAIDVTARFVADSQNITVRTAGRGTISPSGDQAVSGGSSITFTFTPATGNSVLRVVVDGEVQASAPSSWTFRNVTGLHTLNVTFSDISAEQAACLANPRHIMIDGVCYLS